MVNHPRFDYLWESSSEKQRKEVLGYIEIPDKEKVGDWIKHHPCLDLGDKPTSELRQIASRLYIKNYSRLTKSELIRSITQNGPQ